MFSITLTHVVLAAIVAATFFSAVLIRYVYKAIALVNRLSVETANRSDSIKSYLKLARDNGLSPDIHLQLIVNWLDTFKSTCTERQKKRLDSAYDRLVALVNLRNTIDLELRANVAGLAAAKRFLVHRGIGTVSAGLQVTEPDKVPEKVQPRVRFFIPPCIITWKKKNRAPKTVVKLSIRFFDDVLKYWTRGRLVIIAIMSHIKEPVLIKKMLTAVIGVWHKLLAASVTVDVGGNKTTVTMEFLPFVPRRN